jgi:hypothetical protein
MHLANRRGPVCHVAVARRRPVNQEQG